MCYGLAGVKQLQYNKPVQIKNAALLQRLKSQSNRHVQHQKQVGIGVCSMKKLNTNVVQCVCTC